MDQIAKVLLEHGLLGTVALLAILFGWRMYRDRMAAAKDAEIQLTQFQDNFRAEMKALEERYITKAESWMQQYHDLARAQVEVLEAIERRYGR